MGHILSLRLNYFGRDGSRARVLSRSTGTARVTPEEWLDPDPALQVVSLLRYDVVNTGTFCFFRDILFVCADNEKLLRSTTTAIPSGHRAIAR